MVEHKWVAVVDDPEAMAIGPVDTAEKAGDLGQTYGEDDQYRVYPLVAPDDAADYEPPLLVRPGKEPVFHTTDHTKGRMNVQPRDMLVDDVFLLDGNRYIVKGLHPYNDHQFRIRLAAGRTDDGFYITRENDDICEIWRA